jgi:ABC-type branched-subunit amino acid transport system substrate-binding protein
VAAIDRRPCRAARAAWGLPVALLLAASVAPPPVTAATDATGAGLTPATEAGLTPATEAGLTPATEAGLTPAEERGKRIYLHGESPSGGEVTALMGGAGIEVPATALPCASCHGRDGRGRPEGGVEPSNLTWEALTRPYEVESASGRRRGPYTPRLLTRAIGLGIDASGNELDPVMPRYRLAHQDAEDLVAYLARLGRDCDPGVAEASLTLGVLLPPEGTPELAETAVAVRRVVDGYAAHVNAGGGIYHRRLELRYLPLPAVPEARPAALARFAEEEGVFALVASFTAGADAALAAEAARLGVPSVGPLTRLPEEGFPLNRQVFYLDGGLPAQVRALATAAARDGAGGERTAAFVHPAGDEALAELATAAGAGAGFAATSVRPLAPGGGAEAAAALADAGVTDLFLLLPDAAAAALASAAAAVGWTPRLYTAGSLAGPRLLAARQGSGGRLGLAFNSLPVDRLPGAVERFRRTTGLDAAPAATEVAAWTAFDLLLAALEESGRDLSREGLIETLELVRGRTTGLARPVSYGPNRRIGARGAWVVVLDGAAAEPTAVEWVEPG